MPWFVIYTKSRSEKLVAQKLREKGIDVYCPLITTSRRWSDRVKTVQEPLFRSYCFVNLAEPERNRVFEVPGVVRYLYWLQKPAVVRDQEIEAIRRMLNEVRPDQIQLRPFQPGDRLTIQSGNFADLSGRMLDSQGRVTRIMLDTLQMVIQLDLTTTWVSISGE